MLKKSQFPDLKTHIRAPNSNDEIRGLVVFFFPFFYWGQRCLHGPRHFWLNCFQSIPGVVLPSTNCVTDKTVWTHTGNFLLLMMIMMVRMPRKLSNLIEPKSSSMSNLLASHTGVMLQSFLTMCKALRRIQLHDLHHASWSGCLHLQTTFSSSSSSTFSSQRFDLQFKEKFFLEPSLRSFWLPPHSPHQVHASFRFWPSSHTKNFFQECSLINNFPQTPIFLLPKI